MVLLIALAASGPVLAALWSVVEPSGFVPRSLVASLPALALVVGAGVMAAPRAVDVAAAVCLCAGLAIGTARTFGDFTRPPFPPGAARPGALWARRLGAGARRDGRPAQRPAVADRVGARATPVPGFRVVASHRYDGGLGVWVSQEVPA